MKYKLVRKEKTKPNGQTYEVLYLFGNFQFVQGWFICHTADGKEFYKPFNDITDMPPKE